MLFDLAAILVVTGIILFIVGILITRQYTLRAKLLTAFLVIMLASLGVMTWMDSRILRDSLTDSANDLLASYARQYAARIDEFNESTLMAIASEASLPAFAEFAEQAGRNRFSRPRILEILEALQSRHDEYLVSYALLGSDGKNLVDTDRSGTGGDESQAPWFTRVMDSGRVYQSPVIFSDRHDPALYFSAPVMNDGQLAGVLRARYDADVLKQLVRQARSSLGRGAFAILMDERYMRLVHGRRADLQYTLARVMNDTDRELLTQHGLIPDDVITTLAESNTWLSQYDSATLSNPLIAGNFRGAGTDDFTAAVSDLVSMPWRIMIAQSQEVVLEPVAMQTRNALMISAVLVFAVIIVVLGTTQFLLGPIRRLTRVVEGAGDGGQFSISAVVEAEDEIGGLAKAFNSMTRNINRLIEDLEDEVNDHKMTADSLRKLSQAIEQSPVSVLITDLEGNIEYVNPEFCKITGYRAEEVVGKNPRILKSGHTPEAQFKNMWNAITTGQSWSGELYNRKKNGDLFWENVTISPVKNQQGESTHYLAIKEDISLRKDYEERLLYQASYDSLTDLPNRTLAYDRIQQSIANAIRENKHLSLLYLDFDHFKNINDTLGHEAGDQFLIEMSKRLKAVTRDIDTVARLGGDEFLIMITEIGGDDYQDIAEYRGHIQQKAEDILTSISEPYSIDNMEFSVTASIGVSIFPDDGDDPHRLLKNADTAMFRSKRKERGTVEIFTPDMSDRIIRQVELDSKLRHAIADGNLYLNYQGLMDTATHTLVGAEALLRWEDEELGNISPDVFIPLAEESGAIVELGNWVLEQACHDVGRWNRATEGDDMYVALNLSSRQFRVKGFSNHVADALSRHNLRGEHLELEITERLLMKDVPEVVSILNEFKEQDIKLSIDDFGTGYSSLSYLKRFPFDVLKIDKAFVEDIGVDPDDESLCQAIIAMAHSLGLSVIAEGVETEQQFDFLRARGTETVQGYYVSKPMRHDEFVQFISVADWIASTG